MGALLLNKTGETFVGTLELSHDLRSSENAELRNVTRLYLLADQKVTERFGIRFTGNVFYNTRERYEENDDEVFSFDVVPAVYYLLTPDHRLQLNYRYRFQQELDEPGDPITQQNQVGLFLSFRFPQRWE